MIKLFVSKNTARVIIGDCISECNNTYTVKKYIELKFVPSGPNSFKTIDVNFPTPFMDSLLTSEGVDKPIKFTDNEVYVYDEDEISKNTIDFYNEAISGIKVINKMPGDFLNG